MDTNLKRAAARAALAYVEDGMKLGIGTGSTAEELIRLLAERVRDGLNLRCVATSVRTETLCRDAGITMATLSDLPQLDLTIDGADEIGPNLALIKGGGGALLREKIVAAASDRMIVIADQSKLVNELGRFPLPIEIVEFGAEPTRLAILALAEQLELSVRLTQRTHSGGIYITDSGNTILDASFGRIRDAVALANGLANIPGIVEHGLFLGMANLACVASEEGVAEIRA